MSAPRKRLLLWTGLLALLSAGLVYAFLPRPVPVDLVTLNPGPMTVTVEEEGKTRIRDVYVLSAPVAGRVLRIEARVGDAVEAGQTVLAQIAPGDPSFLDPRSEAQARAAVEAAQASHSVAAAQVEEAAAELDFAEAEWRRASELVIDGTISHRELDEAERAHKTRRAALATARANLGVRLFELEQAHTQLMSPAQKRKSIEDCDCFPITAPVSGRVLRVDNPSERMVEASEALLEIGDPTDLEVVVDFLSTDAVRIQPGQRVIIDGWGGKMPLPGLVRRVEPFGFTKTSALGIEEQRVNVIIDFLGQPGDRSSLGHGFQVDARVLLWESEDILTVPLTALFRRGEDWCVFREVGGRAKVTQVQLGQRNGHEAQVVAGLSTGQRIIAHPSDRVRDGVAVEAR